MSKNSNNSGALTSSIIKRSQRGNIWSWLLLIFLIMLIGILSIIGMGFGLRTITISRVQNAANQAALSYARGMMRLRDNQLSQTTEERLKGIGVQGLDDVSLADSIEAIDFAAAGLVKPANPGAATVPSEDKSLIPGAGTLEYTEASQMLLHNLWNTKIPDASFVDDIRQFQCYTPHDTSKFSVNDQAKLCDCLSEGKITSPLMSLQWVFESASYGNPPCCGSDVAGNDFCVLLTVTGRIDPVLEGGLPFLHDIDLIQDGSFTVKSRAVVKKMQPKGAGQSAEDGYEDSISLEPSSQTCEYEYPPIAFIKDHKDPLEVVFNEGLITNNLRSYCQSHPNDCIRKEPMQCEDGSGMQGGNFPWDAYLDWNPDIDGDIKAQVAQALGISEGKVNKTDHANYFAKYSYQHYSTKGKKEGRYVSSEHDKCGQSDCPYIACQSDANCVVGLAKNNKTEHCRCVNADSNARGVGKCRDVPKECKPIDCNSDKECQDSGGPGCKCDQQTHKCGTVTCPDISCDNDDACRKAGGGENCKCDDSTHRCTIAPACPDISCDNDDACRKAGGGENCKCDDSTHRCTIAPACPDISCDNDDACRKAGGGENCKCDDSTHRCTIASPCPDISCDNDDACRKAGGGENCKCDDSTHRCTIAPPCPDISCDNDDACRKAGGGENCKCDDSTHRCTIAPPCPDISCDNDDACRKAGGGENCKCDDSTHRCTIAPPCPDISCDNDDACRKAGGGENCKCDDSTHRCTIAPPCPAVDCYSKQDCLNAGGSERCECIKDGINNKGKCGPPPCKNASCNKDADCHDGTSVFKGNAECKCHIFNNGGVCINCEDIKCVNDSDCQKEGQSTSCQCKEVNLGDTGKGYGVEKRCTTCPDIACYADKDCAAGGTDCKCDIPEGYDKGTCKPTKCPPISCHEDIDCQKGGGGSDCQCDQKTNKCEQIRCGMSCDTDLDCQTAKDGCTNCENGVCSSPDCGDSCIYDINCGGDHSNIYNTDPSECFNCSLTKHICVSGGCGKSCSDSKDCDTSVCPICSRDQKCISDKCNEPCHDDKDCANSDDEGCNTCTNGRCTADNPTCRWDVNNLLPLDVDTTPRNADGSINPDIPDIQECTIPSDGRFDAAACSKDGSRCLYPIIEPPPEAFMKGLPEEARQQAEGEKAIKLFRCACNTPDDKPTWDFNNYAWPWENKFADCPKNDDCPGNKIDNCPCVGLENKKCKSQEWHIFGRKVFRCEKTPTPSGTKECRWDLNTFTSESLLPKNNGTDPNFPLDQFPKYAIKPCEKGVLQSGELAGKRVTDNAACSVEGDACYKADDSGNPQPEPFTLGQMQGGYRKIFKCDCSPAPTECGKPCSSDTDCPSGPDSCSSCSSAGICISPKGYCTWDVNNIVPETNAQAGLNTPEEQGGFNECSLEDLNNNYIDTSLCTKDGARCATPWVEPIPEGLYPGLSEASKNENVIKLMRCACNDPTEPATWDFQRYAFQAEAESADSGTMPQCDSSTTREDPLCLCSFNQDEAGNKVDNAPCGNEGVKCISREQHILGRKIFKCEKPQNTSGRRECRLDFQTFSTESLKENMNLPPCLKDADGNVDNMDCSSKGDGWLCFKSNREGTISETEPWTLNELMSEGSRKIFKCNCEPTPSEFSRNIGAFKFVQGGSTLPANANTQNLPVCVDDAQQNTTSPNYLFGSACPQGASACIGSEVEKPDMDGVCEEGGFCSNLNKGCSSDEDCSATFPFTSESGDDAKLTELYRCTTASNMLNAPLRLTLDGFTAADAPMPDCPESAGSPNNVDCGGQFEGWRCKKKPNNENDLPTLGQVKAGWQKVFNCDGRGTLACTDFCNP